MKLFTSAASVVSSRLGRDSLLVSTLRPAYIRALDFLYAESGMKVRVGDEILNICPRACNFAQVESDVYAYLRANIRPGDTVLDVGAYLGVYAMLSARQAGPQGRVIAFEPTTTSLPFLHRHLVMNGLQNRVRVLACAVGRRSGVVEFYEHTDAYRNSVGVQDPHAPSGAVIRVPMLSIDEACAMFDLQPDLIRIDVQGLEAEVLQGAAQTIRQRPQLKIIIEVHPQLWPLHGLNEKSFKDQLSELGLLANTPNGNPAAFLPDAHLVLQTKKQHY
jgi:FkbM family methyltransferase